MLRKNRTSDTGTCHANALTPGVVAEGFTVNKASAKQFTAPKCTNL